MKNCGPDEKIKSADNILNKIERHPYAELAGKKITGIVEAFARGVAFANVALKEEISIYSETNDLMDHFVLVAIAYQYEIQRRHDDITMHPFLIEYLKEKKIL